MKISARLGHMYSSNKISEHPYLKIIVVAIGHIVVL